MPSWFRRLLKRPRTRPPRPPRVPLGCEPLEARDLPSAALPPASLPAPPAPAGLIQTGLPGGPGAAGGSSSPGRSAGEWQTRGPAMAVADLTGDGSNDFIFGDRELGRLVVQSSPNATVLADGTDGVMDPRAVRLADLNGDGIPDLIVANGVGGNVLVFLGLGGGMFGPEVNGGRGFAVGGVAVDVCVADLGVADPAPALVAAVQGSDELAVLFGSGEGPDWTLTQGPRLAAGPGPDSVAVTAVPGSAYPAIVVADGAADCVRILAGLAPGVFDDRNARVLPTGADPVQCLVGDFTGDGRPDLVVVNAGSGDLTFVRDVGDPLSTGTEVALGGTPVAALAWDGGGNTQLVVADYAAGLLTLLQGGAGGLVEAGRLSSPAEHPTALAAGAAAQDSAEVWVVGEGSESASLVSFTGSGPTPARSSLRPGPATPATPDLASAVNGDDKGVVRKALTPPVALGSGGGGQLPGTPGGGGLTASGMGLAGVVGVTACVGTPGGQAWADPDAPDLAPPEPGVERVGPGGVEGPWVDRLADHPLVRESVNRFLLGLEEALRAPPPTAGPPEERERPESGGPPAALSVPLQLAASPTPAPRTAADPPLPAAQPSLHGVCPLEGVVGLSAAPSAGQPPGARGAIGQVFEGLAQAGSQTMSALGELWQRLWASGPEEPIPVGPTDRPAPRPTPAESLGPGVPDADRLAGLPALDAVFAAGFAAGVEGAEGAPSAGRVSPTLLEVAASTLALCAGVPARACLPAVESGRGPGPSNGRGRSGQAGAS